VLDGVLQGLLGYAVEDLLRLRWHRGLRGRFEVNLDPVPCPERRGLTAGRGDEAPGLQRLRPELEDERPHLGQAASARECT
jgi:hypothetical protein